MNVITLGIGTPGGIGYFLLFGLGVNPTITGIVDLTLLTRSIALTLHTRGITLTLEDR